MKRSVLVLLFMYLSLYANESFILSLAESHKIYKKKEWKALLHYKNHLDIKDPSFILSYPKFSLKNEMKATIKGFFEPLKKYKNINNHPQCKFPARKLFLIHELNISKDEFPQVNCPDLKVYENKAPADNISLIYVSEKVTNPSTMMGHTFLKYSGFTHEGKRAEHAITFYTVIESQNPLTLIYQNLFSGMKGMFSLQPYKNVLFQYTKNENRNVWEYKLSLTKYRKQLIYYHAWELKDVHMKYFFTRYNCSTIIYYMLSLANPNIYDVKKLWITPLNTVKFANKYNLVKEKKLIASNEWIIKMILGNMKADEEHKIKNIVQYNEVKKIKDLDFYSTTFLHTYNELAYENHDILRSKYENIKHLTNEKLSDSNFTFDISNYKSPNKVPNESQFGLGYKNSEGNGYLKLDFLPASHLLNDDNRQYFGESELKIFYLSLLLNKKALDINDFTLYGMKSFVPYDSLTHDLSYQLHVGVEKEYNKNMNIVDTYKIDAGMGIDFLLGNDINVFVMPNFGLGYNNQDNFHVFFNPQMGMMIYELFHMKSLIYYQPLFINDYKVYDKYILKHNLFLFKNSTLYFNISKIIAKKNQTIYEFGMKILF